MKWDNAVKPKRSGCLLALALLPVHLVAFALSPRRRRTFRN